MIFKTHAYTRKYIIRVDSSLGFCLVSHKSNLSEWQTLSAEDIEEIRKDWYDVPDLFPILLNIPLYKEQDS